MIPSVFLSHTSEFTEHGFIDAAQRALRRAGCLGVEMAEYPAVDKAPVHYDAERVTDADIYVGIIGFRYGSLVTGREVSYTEHEFDTATRREKIRLMFLLAPDAALPANCLTDPQHGHKQQAFRDKIAKEPLIYQTFRTPEDLATKLLHSVLDAKEVLDANRGRVLLGTTYDDVLGTMATFTPRPWLTGKIDQFLTTKPSGYFFVEGKSGVGKSTLIAHLATTRGWACHFTSGDRARRTTAATLQSLADQLVVHYELDELRDLEVHGTLQFSAVLAQAASVARAREDQVVLLVDGLEKADDPHPMPFGLPARLPDDVYVITTMREGFEVTGRELPYESTVIDPHGADAIGDVRAHVQSLLRTDEVLRGRVEDEASFTEAVVRHCGGIWIHLRFVLDGIRDGTITVGELPNLAKGLWPYYSRTFDELAESHPGAALPAISTLACTAEPVGLDTLVTLAGVEDKERVRTLMTGPLRNFVHTTAGDDPLYSVMHDSLRDYFTGQRPPDAMTGDESRIDRLRRAAHDTHQRIVHRYWPTDDALTAVGSLDDGYGLRNLVVHLEEAGRQADVHRLLSLENSESNVWFTVHDQHGALVEYRYDISRAWRLAADVVDREIHEGGTSKAVAREIACALMSASVESLIANITPALLRALVEGRVWRPRQAIGRIRAVGSRQTRLDLLGALLQARYPSGRPCLSEEDAAGLWDVAFPLRTGRAHEVAGQLLPRLPADRRTAIVRELLPLALDPGSPGQSLMCAVLAGALDDEQLDRCVTAALAIENPQQRLGTALPALIPHVSTATLSRLLAVPLNAPGADRTGAALAARLAGEGLEPEWVDRHLVDVLHGLDVAEPDRVPLWTVIGTLGDDRRQAVLRTVLGHFARGEHWKIALKLVGLAEFLDGDSVDVALRVARSIDERRWPGARALALAALTKARPPLAAEALRALPRQGSADDHARAATLRLLAPHLPGDRTVAAFVDALPQKERALHLPSAEALEVAARHHGWQRAEILTAVAPRLNHEERLAALALAMEVSQPGPRLTALDALTSGSLDQEELELVLRTMQRIGDEQPRAAAIAALSGQALRGDRPALRARARELLKTCTGAGRADVLIALGDPESLREAALHVPRRPEFGDHAFAARLAAVRPVLSPDEVLRRLLDTLEVTYPDVVFDVWPALAPVGTLSDEHWDVIAKAATKGNDRGYARFLTVGAPHLEEQKQVRKALAEAEGLHPMMRALPMATIAAYLDDHTRRRVVRLLTERGFPRLDAPTAGALARAMTEAEQEQLLQQPLSVEALAAVLPALSPRLRERALRLAQDLLWRFVYENGADFTPIARQADAALLYALLYSVTNLPDETKSRARVAVLGVTEPDAESWWWSEIGPLRDLFGDLGRPGLLAVLAAGARHVALAAGMEAVAECAAAVDDVARWWP
ncbi:DUF4062 domain-containing protein [Lentzea rhizosphaerae]|uniref:DUF4062 domain-containing protein n=1 Tax=Lentzea rhizosphaerae TaxID=2041025 RepID=A0ABV8BKJ3_9PSEU